MKKKFTSAVFYPYMMNEETETEFGKIFRSGIKYSDAYKMYVNTLVHPRDQERMMKAGSIYNILKELEDKKTFITQYRDNEGAYSEMKFVKVGEEENPKAVALGFANRDSEIRQELERQAADARNRAVISGLSDDFVCVVYVGLDDKSEIHYRFDPLFKKHIPQWSSINNYLDGMKILLVEDNEMNREIAEEILSENGVIVETAEDSDIAVDMVKKAIPGQYDLVLMDVQMPRINGNMKHQEPSESWMILKNPPSQSLQ